MFAIWFWGIISCIILLKFLFMSKDLRDIKVALKWYKSRLDMEQDAIDGLYKKVFPVKKVLTKAKK